MLLLFNLSYLTSEESRQRPKAAVWKGQSEAKEGGTGLPNHRQLCSVSQSQTHTKGQSLQPQAVVVQK